MVRVRRLIHRCSARLHALHLQATANRNTAGQETYYVQQFPVLFGPDRPACPCASRTRVSRRRPSPVPRVARSCLVSLAAAVIHPSADLGDLELRASVKLHVNKRRLWEEAASR
jgi:hypothetical protein